MGLIEDIEKKYKRDDLLVLGSNKDQIPTKWFSTGIIQLDHAISTTGGIPAGRITEVYGTPSSGKTTLALCLIAGMHQRENHQALYVDAENALDLGYAEKCGVDLTKLLVARPEYGEQAFDIVEQAIRSGEFPIIILDSIPALSPRAEVEGDIGDAHVALLPRLMSQFLRRTAFPVRESDVAVVLINQVRDKISRFPSPLETPAGWALKHHASLVIFLKNVGEVKTASGSILGSKVNFIIKKNKVGGSHKTDEFEIWEDRGVNKQESLIRFAIEKNVVIQSGSWFSYGEVRTHGMLNLVELLTTDENLYKNILRDATSEEILCQEVI